MLQFDTSCGPRSGISEKRGAIAVANDSVIRCRRIWRSAMIAATLAATGCAANGDTQLNDGEKIIRAAINTLISGQPTGTICVDSRTRGQPLAVFRTMTYAPVPSRAPLGWRAPGPLRAPTALSGRELYDDQIRNERVRLREPGQTAQLFPHEQQGILDTAAAALAVADHGESVAVRKASASDRIIARWWPINRMTASCSPNYVVSYPVWRDNIGFVTVTADHWGTTYAMQRRGADWRTVAQWNIWLY
jgi:hypothetical protein